MANNPYRDYKLLGYGRTSCTFAPEDIQLENTIVQLKNNNTAKKNIERVKTLGLPGINEPRNKLLYAYEGIEEVPANFPKGKCELIDDPENPLRIVKIPYGGKDLSKLAVTQEDIFVFFTGFINIFEGLIVLHKNHIAHLDVKPANMVGEKDGKTYKLRLIDFGLSKKTDDRLDTSDFYFCGYKPRNYPFLSYDLRLLNKKLFNDMTFNLNDNVLVNDINTFKAEFNKYKYPIFLIKDIYPSLVNSIFREINDDNKSQVLLKSDVFSLGLTLYIIWNRITRYGLDDGGELIYTEGQANNFQTGDAQMEASDTVFKLVKKMCNPDPFNRLSLEDALTEYTSVVLPSIERAYPHLAQKEGGSRKLRTRKNKHNNKTYVKTKKKRTTKKH